MWISEVEAFRHGVVSRAVPAAAKQKAMSRAMPSHAQRQVETAMMSYAGYKPPGDLVIIVAGIPTRGHHPVRQNFFGRRPSA
jgi:hypothetical protein